MTMRDTKIGHHLENSLRLYLRALLLLSGLMSVLTLSGCGGGGGGESTSTSGGGGTQSTVTSVSVTCASASVEVGATDQCSPTVQGTSNPSQTVSWSVSPATIGSISSAGLFTASAAGTATITATSTQDSTKSGSATVTVSAPSTITGVSVTCSPASILTNQTSTCTPTVTGTGSFSSSVAWSVSPSSIGTVSNNGIFTPTAAGTATITATSTEDTSKFGSSTVTVTAPPTVTSVTVTCASATVQVEQTDQCTANVQGTSNPSQTVTWAVNSAASGNSTVGTISSAGLYTAPDPIPSSGSAITITATSQADSTKYATAQISLTYPAPSLISVSPSSESTGSADTTLTLNGSGFTKASIVDLDGATLTTSFASTSALSATLPASDSAMAGNHSITVANPSPGGGSSNAVPFAIQNPAPVITSLNPSVVPDGSLDTQVQITGSNFLPGSTVSANSTVVASTFVSATQLVATIPASDLVIAGTVSISVANPSPGGGTSPDAALSVGTQTFDQPGVRQDGTQDPEALSYVVGPPAVPTSTTSQSIGHNVSAAESQLQQGSASAQCAGKSPVDAPTNTCAAIGPDCVPGVPWAPQVGPGDWGHTANCGPAAVLMVHSKLFSTTLNMNDELVSFNQFLEAASACTGTTALCLKKYAGDIDADQSFSTSAGQASFYNGLVVGTPAQLETCMTTPSCLPGSPLSCYHTLATNCSGGGLTTTDLGNIAESQWGLSWQAGHISNASTVSNQSTQGQQTEDCPSQMAWLKLQIDAGLPVIVHVDYKLGLDPEFGYVGHYMVLVGMNGTACSDRVYVVDPGVTDPANGDYTDQTTISEASTSATCNGTTCRYTVGQFLKSWANHGYDALVLSGASTGCNQPPSLGIVAKSISSLTSGQVGLQYSATFAAQYGVPPYTWSIVNGQGNLPPGIQLDPDSGTVSGTPTLQGTFQFFVEVTDANQNIASGVAIIDIGAAADPLTITTPGELQSSTSGKAYSFPLSASGGIVPYHWSAGGVVCPNTIPGLDGVCVSDSGIIQGTPTSATTGPISFQLQVTDSSSSIQTAKKTMTLAVLPANLPPQVYSVAANPSAVNEQATSSLVCTAIDPQQLSLTYAWTVSGGTVSGSGASVTWTAPTAPGGYGATCTVTSSAGLTASGSTVIQVTNSVLNSSISPTSGTLGVTQFTESGSGATPGGGVTATITLPNTTTTTSHTTANGSGQYSFAPFTESVAGAYSEIDSDDKTGNKSLPLSWTVTSSAAPVLLVTPTNAPVSAAAGSTNFSVSNTGTGTLSYSATVMSGSSWLSIASGAAGGNSGTISVSYFANTGTQRSGAIQITASGAADSPMTVTVTQAGVTTSNTRISENLGFDLEFAPAESDMLTWFQSSPYRDIGVYIGGCNVTAVPASGPNGCGSNPPNAGTKKTNTNLTSTWVSDVSGMGWGIMPLWVGPQASCISSNNPSGFYWIDTSTSTSAYNEGVSEADAAATAATALGMGNSVVYYDMEAYSTSDASCDATVGQFISGWVTELRAQGFQAGVYGAPYNVQDWTTPPDALWMFYPDGVGTAADLNKVLSSTWAQKRIHQYCAGGSAQICPSPAQQSYGGVPLGVSPNQGIDLDVEDGPVFSVVLSTGAPSITGLNQQSFPSSNSDQTMLINGTNFQNGDTLTFTYPDGSTHPAARSTSFVSSTQLSYQFNDASDPGTWYVTVNSPDGSQHSNAWQFTVH